MQRFSSKTAIVTGAAAGIGRATTIRLADEGAMVVAIDIDADGARAVAREVAQRGGSALPMSVDVADPEAIDRAVALAVGELGAIDVLVNNAGVAIAGSAVDLTLERWQAVIDINLRSVWYFMHAVLPQMPAGGSVVNMSSAQALLGFPGWAGYAATKGAIIALTQQTAVEYAPAGIRVNCVAPGTIMTPLNEKIFAEATDPDALAAAWGSQHALGRFGEADEVASAIAFLASDDASFVTGVCLPVDGGMSILGPTASAT